MSKILNLWLVLCVLFTGCGSGFNSATTTVKASNGANGGGGGGGGNVTHQITISSSNATLSPSVSTQTVSDGATASFTVTGTNGGSFVISSSAGGTCPVGAWTGAGYTTGAITADCTLSFSSQNAILEDGVSGATINGNAIAVDRSDNSYVAGSTNAAMHGNAQTGLKDFFVTKYDSLHNLLWLRQLGSAGATTIANGIALDSSNNIFAVGYTTGGLNGNSQTGTQDIFIAKYDTSGTLQWVSQFGASNAIAFAYAVTTDSSGNAYVTGYTNLPLNGNAQTGVNDYFIAKYNSSGALQWLIQNGPPGATGEAKGIVRDSSGNIYVAGVTTGAFSGNTVTGANDLFLAKHDSSGNLQWVTQLGSAAGLFTVGYALAQDSSGNLYVTGVTTGGLNGNTQTGSRDLYIAKYNSSGVLQAVVQKGISGQKTYAYGVAIDTLNNCYLTGYTSGALPGNSQTGVSDFFIAKYNSSLVFQSAQQIGHAASNSFGNAIAVSSNDYTYVTGYTDGPINSNTQVGTTDFFTGWNPF